MENTGKATVGSVVTVGALFVVPPDLEITLPVVAYKLIDDSGIEYANGSGIISYNNLVQNSRHLRYTATFTVPSDTPASLIGASYTLVWTLTDSAKFISSYTESIVLTPDSSDAIGSPDIVAVQGIDLKFNAILPEDGAITLELFADDNIVGSIPIANSTQTTDIGYQYNYSLDSTNIIASLDTNVAIWNYASGSVSCMFWVISPAILKATKELLHGINRVKQMARLQELDYGSADLMEWLKMGADRYNSIGVASDFSMTRAEAVIYYGWLTCSKIEMLRSLYMSEAWKSFDFQGQSTQLTVDITQYLDNAIQQLENQVEQMVSTKRQLARKGLTGGDGSFSSRSNNIGAVGISSSVIANAGYGGSPFRFSRFKV